MRSVLGQLVLALAGVGLLRVVLLRHPLRELGAVGTVGLSLLAGPSLLALVTTCLAVVGIPVSLPVLLPLLAPVLLVAVLPTRLPWEAVDHERRRPTWRTAVDLALSCLLVLPAAALISVQRVTPISSNDEYLLWGLRGRALSLTGGLTDYVFTSQRYASLDYPLLVPSLVNWSDRWAGAQLDGAVHAQTGVLLLGLLLTVQWAGQRLAGRWAGLLAALVVVGTPGVLGRYGVFLLADVPLMCFTVSAAAVLLLWVAAPSRRLMGVAGVLLAAALSTKVEGQLFVLALLLGALAARPRHVRLLLGSGLVCVATTVPWRLWLRGEHVQNAFAKDGAFSPLSIYGRRAYAGELAQAMWEQWQGLLGAPLTAVFVAILLGALLRRGAARRQALLSLVTLVLVVLALYAQYLVFPMAPGRAAPEIAERLVNHLQSSGDRVLLFPVALLSLAAVLLVLSALRRLPSPAELPAPAPEPEPEQEQEQVDATESEASATDPEQPALEQAGGWKPPT